MPGFRFTRKKGASGLVHLSRGAVHRETLEFGVTTHGVERAFGATEVSAQSDRLRNRGGMMGVVVQVRSPSDPFRGGPRKWVRILGSLAVEDDCRPLSCRRPTSSETPGRSASRQRTKGEGPYARRCHSTSRCFLASPTPLRLAPASSRPPLHLFYRALG